MSNRERLVMIPLVPHTERQMGRERVGRKVSDIVTAKEDRKTKMV